MCAEETKLTILTNEEDIPTSEEQSLLDKYKISFPIVVNANNSLSQELVNERNKQEEVIKHITFSTDNIISSSKAESERIIEYQKHVLAKLNSELEKQTKLLIFLEEEERARKEAALQLLERKTRLKNQKKKPIRDAATHPEFVEAVSIINSKPHKSEYVRSREVVSLLVLYLTGIRVANLREITASNLKCLLAEEETVYFELNSIKSRRRVVYRTLLTSTPLALAAKYKVGWTSYHC